ncbi:hypothetical protein JOF59_000957 [Streptomyces clavifer]|uniref:Uncharacterized protein n=1 Tax=Streptomyces clavifer TaxID=68188 RepID=A0ABS4V3S0_9ACTN|nr:MULTISPECIES: hypothetical protein [Streptomyces]MBP2358557.1 hypothetical protein [Streptomyces clavifer]MDX2746900.1 hypothetical protein [Streptomyces sp. NRRL_B-2557]
MDALAVSDAAGPARFDVKMSIIVPGSFTRGHSHFATGGHPGDQSFVPDYGAHYAALVDQVSQRLAALAPADADVPQVADVHTLPAIMAIALDAANAHDSDGFSAGSGRAPSRYGPLRACIRRSDTEAADREQQDVTGYQVGLVVAQFMQAALDREVRAGVRRDARGEAAAGPGVGQGVRGAVRDETRCLPSRGVRPDVCRDVEGPGGHEQSESPVCHQRALPRLLYHVLVTAHRARQRT